MDVKMDDLKLSMHQCYKYTLTPTSLTVYFISKDRALGWLFFRFGTVYFHSLRLYTFSLFNRPFWLFWLFLFDSRTVHLRPFGLFILSLLSRPQRVFSATRNGRLLSSFSIVQFNPFFLYRPCFVFWDIQLNTWLSTICFFDRSVWLRWLSTLIKNRPLLTWSLRCKDFIVK